MATELKPCPCCGGKDVKVDYFFKPPKGVKYWFVGCIECGGSMDSKRTRKQAIADWNRRVE